jgi:perosamine synthetase
MDALLAIGERHGIPVIEDAAEAIGSVFHGRRAGSMGRFGAFSFHGTKTITTGEGGMFVTNDPDLYEQVLTLSNHGRARGQTRQFWPDMAGFKYKMSNVQAAIGCAQIQRIDELVAAKRKIFMLYQEALKDLPLRMNPEPDGCTNGYWMPTFVVDDETPFQRDDLIGELQSNGVDARVFFWPLSSTPTGGRKAFETPYLAAGIHLRALNLPSHHNLSDDDASFVCDKVHSYFSRKR